MIDKNIPAKRGATPAPILRPPRRTTESRQVRVISKNIPRKAGHNPGTHPSSAKTDYGEQAGPGVK